AKRALPVPREQSPRHSARAFTRCAMISGTTFRTAIIWRRSARSGPRSCSQPPLQISSLVTTFGRPRPLRSFGDERAALRWYNYPGDFPRARPKGAPVINFRSEGRRFPKGRCLIPASHFFEFTGARSPKSNWKFTKAGEDWFCFAGLWRPMPDDAGDAFTILTTEPGPDVAPIHNRQVVVPSARCAGFPGACSIRRRETRKNFGQLRKSRPGRDATMGQAQYRGIRGRSVAGIPVRYVRGRRKHLRLDDITADAW